MASLGAECSDVSSLMMFWGFSTRRGGLLGVGIESVSMQYGGGGEGSSKHDD